MTPIDMYVRPTRWLVLLRLTDDSQIERYEEVEAYGRWHALRLAWETSNVPSSWAAVEAVPIDD